MKYAPIKIATLNRSTHFIKLIESLKLNDWAIYTDIYIGLDFPPSKKYEEGWKKICDYLDQGDFSVFSSFNIIKRDINYGASKNAYDLAKRIFNKYDRCIVLQDDMEVSHNFIEYMDNCLDAFENDPSVIGVTAYSYPIKWECSKDATCMKQNFNASMWGTGFWRDKYFYMVKSFSEGILFEDYKSFIKKKQYKNMTDACLSEYIPAATSLYPQRFNLLYMMSDVSLRAYLAKADKFFISPIFSKTRNNGFDGSGLYCQDIAKDGKGTTSYTYDYSIQPIDNQKSFELKLNDESFLDINRIKLNNFDYRSPQQMKDTQRKLWLSRHLGLWAARLYYVFSTPYKFLLKIRH